MHQMRAGFVSVALIAALLRPMFAVAAAATDLTGRWEVTTSYPGGSFVAGLDLQKDAAGRYSGKSGYLVPDGFFYQYAGSLEKGVLHLQILEPDGKTSLGAVALTAKGSDLTGKGTIREVPVTVSARRPLPRPAEPRVIDFVPKAYYHTLSGSNPPALHIFPRDTVRTSTVDALGGGANPAQRALPGNRQTGPFYIEGAMIGDTIAVHFNRIRPNRDSALQYHASLAAIALPPGYPQEPSDDWSMLWKVDRERNIATPVDPSDKLKGLELKLVPMLGVVGVAPYWDQAIAAADLGPFGGNLDYNQIREGVTLYLPVYQAGALLSMGDGHALQGDGEVTGQGLETSMDVEFTVDLIPDHLMDQPWAENDQWVMVSGIGGSLTEALQNATGGLANWLHAYYQLNTSEVATVLANAIHYDVAEVVDGHIHVAAKISKQTLGQLPKPERPKAVFCRMGSGCMPN